MTKLICEVFNDNCETVVESTDEGNPKSYFIEGIFMQGDVKNRNGRLYPSQILEREMHRYSNEFITTNRALGELDHPQGPAINSDRVSHRITEMQRDGNNFIGKAKILNTPMGKIVKEFIDEGIKIGVSTRGLGSLKTVNGIMEVKDDFRLATVDIVTNPSGPDCFVNGIMENTEYYYDIASGNWVAQQAIEEIKEEIEKKITKTVRRIDESDAVKMFEKFLKTL